MIGSLRTIATEPSWTPSRYTHDDTLSSIQETVPKIDPHDMSFSFCGCGFLGIYHIGVAAAIKEYIPDFLKYGKAAGASAGSLAAAILLSNACLGQGTTEVLNLVMQARATALGPMHPGLDLRTILRDILDKMLPQNAHIICTKRLYLSLTRFHDGKNVIISDFASKEELIQALVCSSFIPFYFRGALPPALRGVRYMDGGFTSNMVILDHRRETRTITVSPFSGEADICPSDNDSASFFGYLVNNTSIRFTARNLYRLSVALFPPHPEVMARMCQQGFEDAVKYLARNDMISCARCLSIRACITVPDEEELVTIPKGNLVDRGVDATPPPKQSAAARRRKLHPGARMRTSETKTPVSMQHHHDMDSSECDICLDTMYEAPRKGLPTNMQDSLNKANVSKNGIFSYVLSFRVVRYARYLTLPYILPWQYTYALIIRILTYLPFLPIDILNAIKWTTSTIMSLISDFNTGRHDLSARFSCQMAVTELNYNSPAYHENLDKLYIDQPASRDAADVFSNMTPNRKSGDNISLSSMGSMSARAAGTLEEVDYEYGVSVNMSMRNRTVRDIVNIYRQETGSRDAYGKSNLQYDEHRSDKVAHTTSEFWSEAMKSSASPELDQDQECDNLTSIVNYTRHHEALMSYYYMDNGKMKVTEIFGVGENLEDAPPSLVSNVQNHSSINSMSRTPSRRHSKTNMQLHRPQQEMYAAEAPCSSGFQPVVDDSGVEESVTRDACTSPIPDTCTSGMPDLRRSRSGRPLSSIIAGNELTLSPNSKARQSLRVSTFTESEDTNTDDDRLFQPKRMTTTRLEYSKKEH